MADLEIAEYAFVTLPRISMPAGEEPEAAFTLLSYGASTQHAFGPTTRMVRLKARSGRCYVKFGANPTATAATSKSLEQNVAEYFVVRPGMKVAAYDGIS
jgi:hypothetical protein